MNELFTDNYYVHYIGVDDVEQNTCLSSRFERRFLFPSSKKFQYLNKF